MPAVAVRSRLNLTACAKKSELDILLLSTLRNSVQMLGLNADFHSSLNTFVRHDARCLTGFSYQSA